MARRRRPSLMGGLLWILLGLLFLLRNFDIGPDIWSLFSRYWPLLLILAGLGKVIDYYRHKEGVSLRFGEIFGILFLILLGAFVSRVSQSPIRKAISDFPVIQIGGEDVALGDLTGTSYSFDQEATYPLRESMPIRVDNAWGAVSVLPGSDGEIHVRLKKSVYEDQEAQAKSIAEEISLEGGADGETFVIKTNRDDLESKEYRFRTDMEILVPKKARVEVKNSRGDVSVTNIEGKLDLSTSHKRLDVRNCSGSLTASNRYAETRVTDFTGDVKSDSRGGRVSIESIRGNVEVRNEYSPVDVQDVDGKVVVNNTDGSITVTKVTKPVVLDSRGNRVKAQNLSDSLDLTTTNARVDIKGIGSRLTLDSRYSTLSLGEIRGDTRIKSNSDRITADNLEGAFTVQAQGSAVRANRVRGPIDITTSLKEIIVNDFSGACQINGEYSDVSLSTRQLPTASLTVKNKNGQIDLFLPTDASFSIDATARFGRVASDFKGLQTMAEAADTGYIRGSHGTGGPKIRLENEYGNISVRSRTAESARAERN